jgi:hypothetical protein
MNSQPKYSTIVFLLLLFNLSTIFTVYAQDSNYPTIVVDYRELRIVPEDFSSLKSVAPPFSNNHALIDILSSNNTWFWEPLGSFNDNFSENSTLSTYAIVTINETGFCETLVGLSKNNQSLIWTALLSTSISANFSKVVHIATDFFANDDIYWGLCEEIVVIPGNLVGFDFTAVWRLAFHLIAESERWTLLIDTSGNLLDTAFVTIPCPLCPYSPFIVVGISIVVALCVVAVVYIRMKFQGVKHSKIQD